MKNFLRRYIALGTFLAGLLLFVAVMNFLSAPINTFSASPTQGLAPLSVTFVGLYLADIYPISVYINFGDGRYQELCNESNCGDSDSLVHTYTVPGTYIANLEYTSGSPVEYIIGTSTIVVR